MDDASAVAPIFVRTKAASLPNYSGQYPFVCHIQSNQPIGNGTYGCETSFSERGIQQRSLKFAFPSIPSLANQTLS
jgi:hypothetical protein